MLFRWTLLFQDCCFLSPWRGCGSNKISMPFFAAVYIDNKIYRREKKRNLIIFCAKMCIFIAHVPELNPFEICCKTIQFEYKVPVQDFVVIVILVLSLPSSCKCSDSKRNSGCLLLESLCFNKCVLKAKSNSV